jgi:hypothetical protein
MFFAEEQCVEIAGDVDGCSVERMVGLCLAGLLDPVNVIVCLCLRNCPKALAGIPDTAARGPGARP